MDKNELTDIFTSSFKSFIDNCIPLSKNDNIVYFMSKSNQMYGLDTSKQSLFEPNSSNKYKIINSCIDLYFNDDVKKSFETKTGVKFNDLTELLLKFNYREKNIGKKFFYSNKERKIFVWSLINHKWEIGDDDELVYLFTNSNIIKKSVDKLSDSNLISNKENKTTKNSLEDLGANFEDMEEVPKRFKDASIHYYNNKDKKIYSLNIISGSWYIPDETIQKQILVHVIKSQNSSTDKNLVTNL